VSEEFTAEPAEQPETEPVAGSEPETALSPELLEELDALASKVAAEFGSAETGKPSATSAEAGQSSAEAVESAESVAAEKPAPSLQDIVDERTADLQRLQAEYTNYKRRVDRDRALARQSGIETVILALLPVLDSVEAAREHEELVGGFRLVADELEKISAKFGLEVFGEVGEPFDPQIHEALMQMPYEGEVDGPTIAAVMQKGVKLNDRVLRPARVGVANPEE
jgi:molecular chaperone GrpE